MENAPVNNEQKAQHVFSSPVLTIQLPRYFYLTDQAKELESLLAMKRMLTDVFTTYSMLYDHGATFSTEYNDHLAGLLLSLHDVIDIIAITANDAEKDPASDDNPKIDRDALANDLAARTKTWELPKTDNSTEGL
jgi:hypothetical protein